MRDLVLTLVLIGLLPVALARPFVGALAFACVSLLNPHRFTWGFAYALPFAQMLAIATIIGLVRTREKIVMSSIKGYALVLAYLSWMAITSAFAFYPEAAWARWETVAKVHLMCLVTFMLLTDWQRTKWLLIVSVLSVAFFGLKGGIFTLATGGSYRVWGPPDSAITDNNHLATGLVMMIPLLYWMYASYRGRWLRWTLLFTAAMTAVAVFGSHSRGAFLAISAMALLLIARSRHRFLMLALVVLAALVLAPFMPQEYWQRIESIQSYEQDASAQGRINAWHMAFNVANDRLTGAGFENAGAEVFARYAPIPDLYLVAHSIYFQALGDHGWPGLAFFLAIVLRFWMINRRVAANKRLQTHAPEMVLLARMLNVSLAGFLVGGAFLNLGNWDMFYYLLVVSLALRRCAGAVTSPGVVSPGDSMISNSKERFGVQLSPGARRTRLAHNARPADIS